METISTTAIVKNGRITVEVPAADGISVNVIIRPHRTPTEVKALVTRIDRLRAEKPIPAADPDTLRDWEEEGRP